MGVELKVFRLSSMEWSWICIIGSFLLAAFISTMIGIIRIIILNKEVLVINYISTIIIMGLILSLLCVFYIKPIVDPYHKLTTIEKEYAIKYRWTEMDIQNYISKKQAYNNRNEYSKIRYIQSLDINNER